MAPQCQEPETPEKWDDSSEMKEIESFVPESHTSHVTPGPRYAAGVPEITWEGNGRARDVLWGAPSLLALVEGQQGAGSEGTDPVWFWKVPTAVCQG